MNEPKRHGAPDDLHQIWTSCPKRWRFSERWGADAIRDCDGTDFPEELTKRGREGLLHLLHHPQGQRLGQGQPGRGAAVLHHDRLPHRRRRARCPSR